MALVRERRHQRALSLSLPSPALPAERSPLPSPSSSSSTDQSPGIDSLLELEKLAVLGHGNGGVVYKVRHRRTASVYALKVLRFDEKAVVIQHQAPQEAEILKRMDSPLIVKCHGVFNGKGDPIVMAVVFALSRSIWKQDHCTTSCLCIRDCLSWLSPA
ncbi:hypothetical protein RHMOL_Rhmol11G0062700 [Rhododendron molle]|uniref:Uncharacterized protein n=1 Tax=Rhododendron molle TaxID=49168 RepID=A0ACC0LP48_RHOML|nr:hypothetical protein RHMOL_Rhmol11G0062700 [Rhododendron molle]